MVFYSQSQHSPSQAVGRQLQAIGHSLAGLSVCEDIQLAIFLAMRAGVPKEQIVAICFSMGACQAWQVGTLFQHIQAAAICGFHSYPYPQDQL